jgi:hypothetical protein
MMILYVNMYHDEKCKLFHERNDITQLCGPITVLRHYYPETRGCIAGCQGSAACKNIFAAFWIPFGVLESIVLFLTARKSLQSCRHTLLWIPGCLLTWNSVREIQAIGGKTTVINIIMRDGQSIPKFSLFNSKLTLGCTHFRDSVLYW